ncbi:MAG: hypothetical protein EBY39_01895, partial [Flavobacteriia bacterium]|nr:hypothetical protein [Flavobacteriia bacterium]
GLDAVIPNLKQPVLGICLGMQLMCRSTEEGNTKGLEIFDVDVKGGITLKQHFGEKALSVFIAPPSLGVLEERLRSRGTESEEDLQKRIGKAAQEMTHKSDFDKVLVNKNLERACQQALEMAQDFLAD